MRKISRSGTSNQLLWKTEIIHLKKAAIRREVHLAQFKQGEQGILLACDMCQLGFDDTKLAFAVIAKNVKNRDSLQQILGRVVRNDEDKIGYLLAFSEVYKKIQDLLRGQALTKKIDPDYLAQGFFDDPELNKEENIPGWTLSNLSKEVRTLRFPKRPLEVQASHKFYKEQIFKLWMGEEMVDEYGYEEFAWKELYKFADRKDLATANNLTNMMNFLQEDTTTSEPSKTVCRSHNKDNFAFIRTTSIRKK